MDDDDYEVESNVRVSVNLDDWPVPGVDPEMVSATIRSSGQPQWPYLIRLTGRVEHDQRRLWLLYVKCEDYALALMAHARLAVPGLDSVSIFTNPAGGLARVRCLHHWGRA